MIVIQITDDAELARTIDMMKSILEFAREARDGLADVRVGIDPLDNGLKFSINGSVWSPPARGVIQ